MARGWRAVATMLRWSQSDGARDLHHRRRCPPRGRAADTRGRATRQRRALPPPPAARGLQGPPVAVGDPQRPRGRPHLAVLAFNFRGVMGSGGTYGGGRDEVRDVAAAIRAARNRAPAELPTALIGWSFGANVAVRAAIDDQRAAALALIGLPLAPNDLSLPPLPDATDLRALRRPVLLLAGEHDTFAPATEVEAYASSFPQATVRIVAGTDHYFWRREREAAAIVGGFVERVLTPA